MQHRFTTLSLKPLEFFYNKIKYSTLNIHMITEFHKNRMHIVMNYFASSTKIIKQGIFLPIARNMSLTFIAVFAEVSIKSSPFSSA